MDHIILIKEGVIKEQGTFEKLSKSGPLFQKLMESAGKIEEKANHKTEKDVYDKTNFLPATDDLISKTPNGISHKRKGKLQKSRLIKQEERETGVVSWKVLTRYV